RHMGSPGDAALYEAWQLDYGPRFHSEGIIEHEPPLRNGKAYPSLVSTVDALGNEVSGIPTLELVAPLATYTPWRRWDYPNSFTKLTDAFTGSVIPLPRNEQEKQFYDDPRPTLEHLYPNRKSYLETAGSAARALVAQGFLLAEDVDAAVALQGHIWDWIMGRPMPDVAGE
ncbi:MAG: alpha/beta hydrolase domain-containing protein, partial [Pseudomonadota bacterium]